MVLNGHISKSNVKYVWRSEHGENTCEKCEDKDKNEYESDEDVPPQPHPNCKCYIEVVPVSFEKIEVEDTTDKKLDDKWIMPVPNGYKVISGYGYRMHPVYNVPKLHDGIDINTPENTPVYSVAKGVVTVAGWVKGYGNYIQIKHMDGLSSFYAHLNRIDVKNGVTVKKDKRLEKLEIQVLELDRTCILG